MKQEEAEWLRDRGYDPSSILLSVREELIPHRSRGLPQYRFFLNVHPTNYDNIFSHFR